MNFVNLQPSFTRVSPKVARVPAKDRNDKKPRVAQPAVMKPELFGRVSEVTIAAFLLAMLAPIGAIAYAAGMPGMCMAAGAVAGLFGAGIYFVEKWAIARS